MLAFLAAVMTATAPVPALEASVPWWERITVTVDDKGTQQSCKYQSSLAGGSPEDCDREMASTIPAIGGKGSAGLFSKLTFERRFSPGAKLDSGQLQTGDKLLGQQVMYLTLSGDGSIAACKVVGQSGDMVPAYGCEGAKTEQFKVPNAQREAFLTIMVYGHEEHIA